MLLRRLLRVSVFAWVLLFVTPVWAQAQCTLLLDLDGNGVVDSQDMFAATIESDLIQLHACLDVPRGDLDGDSHISFVDFLVFSTNVGSPEDQRLEDGDINLDRTVDIRDFAILSSNFDSFSYKPEPPAVEASSLRLSIDASNRIVISGELELGGISFRSDNDGLAGADAADPFIITLVDRPDEITLVQLGNTLSIAGSVTTEAKVKPGVGVEDIYAEWFDLRSYEVFSNAIPNLDCNGDGSIDGLDLSCICGTRGYNSLFEELGLLPGDLNGDGEVAFADFLVLSENYLQEVEDYTAGDTNCDGRVNFVDFITLSSNFGRTFANAGGSTASTPEPQGNFFLLVFFSASAISLSKRRVPRS